MCQEDYKQMANIHLSGDVATTKAPKKEESYTSIDSGPYVAIVKQNYFEAPNLHADRARKLPTAKL